MTEPGPVALRRPNLCVMAMGLRGRAARWSPGPDRPPAGAENLVMSCDLHVLVYEAAESVASQWPNGRAGGVRPAGRC
jgi:hypothetical protein